MATSIGRFWRASARVYPEPGLRSLIARARYVGRARSVAPQLDRLLDAPPESPLGKCVAQRPEIVGLVVAPFINASWGPRKRLDSFLSQFDYLQKLGPAFDFDISQSIELPRIDALGDEYLIVLDKPKWFQREGLLTLNIFRHNVRLFSLAFSIDEVDGKRTIIIGALQGRRIEGALDEYRQLTKLAHGLRPRDLLIDCLRMIASAIGAERIIAVSDACRHHRHPFFGQDPKRELPLDYDEIWRDRGGQEISGGFFELPLERQQRPLEEVSAKKRSMYRQRYAMLDTMEKNIRDALPRLKPVTRPEAD
jgi:uncharacterized protein VirK/YbjX